MSQKKETNADMLYRMACGFHKVGVHTAWQVVNGTGPDAFMMIGAAAVNLALAAELYLKAVHSLNARRPPEIHELWKLFKTLPRVTVDLLNTLYSQAFVTNTSDELKAIQIVTRRASDIEKKNSPSTPNTVKLLLQGHNHAFVNWRYLHEFDGNKGYDYNFDFHAMHIFCGVMNSHVADLLKARTPHFGMTNVNTGESV